MRTVALFMLCVVLSSKSLAQDNDLLCLPNRPSTCKYGGVCKSVSTNPLLIQNQFQPQLYVCKCEPIACIDVMGFDPVCAADGNTYPNDLCRRVHECAIQKAVPFVCKGSCNSNSCVAVQDNVQRCSENFSNFCFNFGECLVNPSSPEAPFCRCLNGYEGDRCQKRLARVINEGGQNNCGASNEEINYKLAFLCCLGVLALLLILQTVYCIIRCYGSSNKPVWKETSNEKSYKTTSVNEINDASLENGNDKCSNTENGMDVRTDKYRSRK